LDEETVTASSLNSFKNNLVRLRKHMKIGHVLGKCCLWTYEAEAAATGKASVGELSVSNMCYSTKFLNVQNHDVVSHHFATVPDYQMLLSFLSSCEQVIRGWHLIMHRTNGHYWTLTLVR